MSEVNLDIKTLENIVKLLGDDIPTAKIGVLGDKNSRGELQGNAEIGLKHEFGEEGLPARSFLRIPLSEKMEEFLEKAGIEDSEKLIAECMKERTLEPFIKKIALVGEDIVQEAFNTGGFGKWKPSNMKFKKNHQTLVETQQLRNSITSKVGNDD